MRLARAPWVVALALTACNLAPSPVHVGLAPANPTTEDPLRLVIHQPSVDPDGEDAVALAIRWHRDGEPVAALDDAMEVPPELTAKGEVWTVEVVPNDGRRAGVSGFAFATIGNAAPSVALKIDDPYPALGEDLVAEATATDPDGDAVSLTWSWTVNGLPTELSGPTVPGDRTTRGDRWEVTVAAADADGGVATGSASASIANRPPFIGRLELQPAIPDVTADLRAVTEAFDDDGDDVSITWQWVVDGAVQPTAGDTLPASAMSRGAIVSVTAIPRDAYTEGDALSRHVAVANARPTVAGAAISPPSPQVGDALTCAPGPMHDADGDALTAEIRWFAGDAMIGEGPTLDGGFTKGQTVRCMVSANDGIESGPAAEASALVRNTAPAIADLQVQPFPPVASGDAFAVFSPADADADVLSYDYRWFVNGRQTSTGPTLPAGSFRKGDELAVEITPFDGEAHGGAARATALVANSRPILSRVDFMPGGAGEPMRVIWAASDADRDPLEVRVAWTVNGALQPEQGAMLTEGFTRGDVIQARVVVTDGDTTSVAITTAPYTVPNQAPAIAGARLDPAAFARGDTVECVPEGWFDPEGDAPQYRFEWFVNGRVVSATPILDGSQFARGDVVSCAATPFDGLVAGLPAAAAPATVANARPSLATARLDLEAPEVTDVIGVLAGGANDPDGDVVQLEIAWFVNGAQLATGPTLSGAYFAMGDEVFAVVTPFDGIERGEPIHTARVAIANARPIVSSVILSPQQVHTHSAITALWQAHDPDGAALVPRFEWVVDGLPVAAAGPVLDGAEWFEKGQSIAVRLTVSDGALDSEVVESEAVGVANSAPSGALARVSPEVIRTGDFGSCAGEGFSDADGDAEGWTFRWFADGVEVAYGPSLASGQPRGASLTCEATPTDGEDAGAPILSAPVVVANTPPRLDAVAIGATEPRIGDHLVAIVGDVRDPDGDAVSLEYRWLLDGAVVSTSASWVVADAPVGARLELEITPTDGEHAGEVVRSEALSIANSPPIMQSVSLSGTTGTAGSITVDWIAEDPNGDALSPITTWFVNGAVVEAVGPTITGAHFDKGDAVRAEVAVHDGAITSTPMSSDVVIIANTAPSAPIVAIDPAEPTAEDDLVCAVVEPAVDPDGDPIELLFAWRLADEPYEGELLQTTHPGDTLPAAAIEPEQVWRCEVFATDDVEDSEIAFDEVEIAAAFGSEASYTIDHVTVHRLSPVALPAGDLRAWYRDLCESQGMHPVSCQSSNWGSGYNAGAWRAVELPAEDWSCNVSSGVSSRTGWSGLLATFHVPDGDPQGVYVQGYASPGLSASPVCAEVPEPSCTDLGADRVITVGELNSCLESRGAAFHEVQFIEVAYGYTSYLDSACQAFGYSSYGGTVGGDMCGGSANMYPSYCGQGWLGGACSNGCGNTNYTAFRCN